jgi:hypothetical protein
MVLSSAHASSSLMTRRGALESITQYIEQRLKLRVNRQKSAVAPAVERPLLGFQFFPITTPAHGQRR